MRETVTPQEISDFDLQLGIDLCCQFPYCCHFLAHSIFATQSLASALKLIKFYALSYNIWVMRVKNTPSTTSHSPQPAFHYPCCVALNRTSMSNLHLQYLFRNVFNKPAHRLSYYLCVCSVPVIHLISKYSSKLRKLRLFALLKQVISHENVLVTFPFPSLELSSRCSSLSCILSP